MILHFTFLQTIRRTFWAHLWSGKCIVSVGSEHQVTFLVSKYSEHFLACKGRTRAKVEHIFIRAKVNQPTFTRAKVNQSIYTRANVACKGGINLKVVLTPNNNTTSIVHQGKLKHYLGNAFHRDSCWLIFYIFWRTSWYSLYRTDYIFQLGSWKLELVSPRLYRS